MSSQIIINIDFMTILSINIRLLLLLINTHVLLIILINLYINWCIFSSNGYNQYLKIR